MISKSKDEQITLKSQNTKALKKNSTFALNLIRLVQNLNWHSVSSWSKDLVNRKLK